VAACPTPYEESKRAADRLIADYVGRGGDAVTVHPTRVFGPGPLHDANGATRLIAGYLAGWCRFRLADGDVRGNYVFVDDVAAGMVLAAHRGVVGGCYTLGGENISVSGLLSVIDRVAGTQRWTLPLPPRVAAVVAGVAELGGHTGFAPFITRGWIRTYLQDHAVSIDGTVRDLGYRPRTLQAGVRETVRWLRNGRRTSHNVLLVRAQ
jgi:nucleoside-diphosphate-sugar epimerase